MISTTRYKASLRSSDTSLSLETTYECQQELSGGICIDIARRANVLGYPVLKRSSCVTGEESCVDALNVGGSLERISMSIPKQLEPPVATRLRPQSCRFGLQNINLSPKYNFHPHLMGSFQGEGHTRYATYIDQKAYWAPDEARDIRQPLYDNVDTLTMLDHDLRKRMHSGFPLRFLGLVPPLCRLDDIVYGCQSIHFLIRPNSLLLILC